MFNNDNNDDNDDSTANDETADTEFHVIDREGDTWQVCDTEDDAIEEMEVNEEDHPEWAPYHINEKSTDDMEFIVYHNETELERFDTAEAAEQYVERHVAPNSQFYVAESGEAADETPEFDEDHSNETLDEPEEMTDPVSAEELLDDLEDIAEEHADDGPSYGFFSDPEMEHTESHNVTKWGLGNHSQGGEEASGGIEDALSNLDASVDGEVYGLLQEASTMVNSVQISGFECGTCGLNHGHSDTKHDIRSAFGITDEFVELMEFCPFCHCGVNEMAMLIDFYGHIETDVFTSGYGSVEDMSAGSLDDLLTEYSRSKSARSATEFANVRLNNDVREFLHMVDDIKSAASSAPISQETRTRIDELRAETESFIQG